MEKLNRSTAFIELATLTYPVYLSAIRTKNKTVSIAENPSADQMLLLGYAVVARVDRPDGDVVTEGVPVETETGWIQTWEVRAFNEQEIAQQLNQAKQNAFNKLNTSMDNTLAIGFEYIFADADVLHIQLRDGDRANLAGLRLTANELIELGELDPILEIMSYENIGKNVTPAEMVELTRSAFVNFTGTMKQKWVLKTQVKAATTVAEIPSIPDIIPVFVSV